MNAEFLCWHFFYRAVSVDDAFYLAVTGDAYINTAYCMGTSAMMLHTALLWTYTSLYSTGGCCLFTAVDVCVALHTAARVDAAPFTAVRVGATLPFFYLLLVDAAFILSLGWMLPLIMRLV